MARKNRKTGECDKSFADRFGTLLEEKDVRQYEVAEVIGRSRQSVGYYKDGRSEPDLGAIVKIAKYFDVTTDWLLGVTTSRQVDGACRCGIREDLLNALMKMKPEERNAYCELMMAIIDSGIKVCHKSDTNG